MVLTPILKSSLSAKLNTSRGSVTFSLPDEDSIIDYLKNEEIPYSSKVNSITKRITAADTEDALLLKWIKDFKDNILFLEKNDRIIYSLLNIQWYVKDENFVSVYQDLVLNLVTAHPPFIKAVLAMIFKIFSTVQDSSTEEITDFERSCFQNGHKLLLNIIKLVPLCEQPLCLMLSQKFPYMKSPTKMICCYVQNLLEMRSYFPSKRLFVLECIIEKLVHIDVYCSRQTIEIAEKENEEEESHLMEGVDSPKTDAMAHPLAETLNCVMDMMYKYMQETCYGEGSTLDWDATKKLYKELLTVFDKIILPTHGCCHVHYLLFHICSFKQDLSDGFLDYLWKKVQNPNIGPVYRQIAAFYIGSTLARAKYVTISTVAACLDLMCKWLHSYIDNHTAQDLNVHGTFHSVCQTVFYVFAFRSQELMELDKGNNKGFKFLRSLNFDRIVTCRLNPLRYCDRNILQNFANIARNYQIAYVYPIIERNNRSLLYSNPQTSAESCAGAMVQTFFPFDPYLLKKSKHLIESNYRVYSHCQKDKEEENMDTADEDDTDLTDALFSYGQSPGFKKSYLVRR